MFTKGGISLKKFRPSVVMASMSVEKSNNGIKLNVPFMKPYKTGLSDADRAFLNIDMSSYKSLNLDRQKGLTIEQHAENTQYEYYENGNVKSSSSVNPETGETQSITYYSEYGNKVSETNFTKDLMETIIYNGSRKTHTYTDLQTGKIISSQTYDSKKRLAENYTYDKETGYLTSSVSYNPETGKPLLENKYNPQIDGQLLSMTITDDRFPTKHFVYKYNDDNMRIKTEQYDENMNLTEATFEEGYPPYKEYYDKEGNVTEKSEIIDGYEINSIAQEIYDNPSDENIKKINKDNVLDILNDYKILNNADCIDIDEGYGQGLIDNILKNSDTKVRNSQLSHIANAIKEKLDAVRHNSIELYCNDMEAVDKSLDIIKKRLDNIPTDSTDEIRKTLNVANNMITNNDLFVDVANGRIDKANYQGKRGDCWLLATINSIAESPNGQKLLEDCLEVNPETNDVTVKLMGGEKEYLITNEELQYSGDLSRGDYDLRAIELAFQKHFTQMSPPQTFDGNYASNALQIITGNETKMASFSPMTGLLEVDGQVLDKTTAGNFKNTPLCVLNKPESFTRLEELQPDVAICAAANTSEFTRHQYWIKIDGDNIIVKEPNNAQNEKVYTQDEFRNIFDGILMVMVL